MHKTLYSFGAISGTNAVQHNGNIEWLMEQRRQAESVHRQQDVSITTKTVELKEMLDWKSPGPEEVSRILV